MKTERLVVLVTPQQKQSIMARAKALNMSAGEVIRCSVDNYRPNDEEAILAALGDELERSARETRKALQSARAEVQRTVKHLAAHRKAAAETA